jgi:translation initiation factor 1A
MNNKQNDTMGKLPIPKRNQNEFFAVVDKRLGGSRLDVSCGDGKSRMARIPGGKRRKFKKIRTGDLLIIQPWEIQNEKADVVFHYNKNQARFLSRINRIPKEIDVF